MLESNVVSLSEHELFAICPLDGRYRNRIRELEKYVSEAALIRHRVLVEVLWFKKLCSESVGNLCPLKEGEAKELDSWIDEFSVDDARQIKSIEKKINHDVKAVEYFLKHKAETSGNTFFKNHLEMFHFALSQVSTPRRPNIRQRHVCSLRIYCNGLPWF